MTERALQQSVAAAHAAMNLHTAALVEFGERCEIADWNGAERARLRAIAHLEAYLDNMAAAHRLMQRIGVRVAR